MQELLLIHVLSCSTLLADSSGKSSEAAAHEEDAVQPSTSDVGRQLEATNSQRENGQPSISGRPSHEEVTSVTSVTRKQSNTKDLKATGVARAAARLLEQDDPEGGLGILSVCPSWL